MPKITAPNERWANVTRVGVEFKDGKGSTDDETKLAFFRRQGYTVEQRRRQTKQETDPGRARSTSRDSEPQGERSEPESDAQPERGE